MDARGFSLFLLVVIHHTNAGQIKLEADGGYVDMVIAIRDDVEESSDLLAAIQREFKLASSHLHTATRNMTYFKEIRILIPPSWAQSDRYEESTWESYLEADILIRPNKRHVPYVKSYGPCGTPGMHMFLTPEFISDHEKGRNYGRPQKTLVHEFGHLRWGLKDEYPYDIDHDIDSRYHHFYENSLTKKVEGTRCVEAIPGDIGPRIPGRPCTNSPEDGLPDKKSCSFKLDRSTTNYKASFMFNQHLDTVTEFCDGGNEVDPIIRHNIHAPNRQNIQCNYQSAWEVMRQHADFSTQPRPSPDGSISPSFKLVKEVRTTTTVLVLDTSGSMEGKRLSHLRSTAWTAINDVLPFGSRLGMVKFSGSASVLARIQPISTNVDRQILSGLLPSTTDESDALTSIGSGIRKAVEILRADTVRAKRKIIVVSDGEENMSPYVQDVLHEVTEAQVVVSTIAVGATVDTNLEDLSGQTNGKHFANSDGFTSLYQSFHQSTRGNDQSVSEAPFILETSSHAVPSGSNFTESFYVDEALTGDLKIILSYYENMEFDGEAMLTTPNGTAYTILFINVDNLTLATYVINGESVQVGTWNLTVLNRGVDDNFEVIIQPGVTENATSIAVDTFWALDNMEPPQRQILYVAISQDLNPVINAEVSATITVTSQEGEIDESVIFPLDNGAGADSNDDDGVYSLYFTNLTSAGRYSVQVEVRGKADTQLANGVVLGGGSSLRLDEDEDSPIEEFSYQPTGYFQREIIGQSFVCEGQACIDAMTLDLYSPTEITDLTATNVQPENNTITLKFTAPGDDLSDGSASMYEFRYSLAFSELVYRFNETEIIPEDWFILGDTSAPGVAGSEETFVIRVNETGSITYSIAVVAIDDEMNRSQRSNIATSSGSLLFDQLPSRSLGAGAIAGITIVVLLPAVLIVILAVYRTVYRDKKKDLPILTEL